MGIFSGTFQCTLHKGFIVYSYLQTIHHHLVKNMTCDNTRGESIDWHFLMRLLSIITCLSFTRPPVIIHNELLCIKSRYNGCTRSMTISKQQFNIKLIEKHYDFKVINLTCTSFVLVHGEWPIRTLYPINIVFWVDDYGVWVRLCLFTHSGVQIHTVLCFCFAFRRLVCHMLPVSLDCPFLIALSVFCNSIIVLVGLRDTRLGLFYCCILPV